MESAESKSKPHTHTQTHTDQRSWHEYCQQGYRIIKQQRSVELGERFTEVRVREVVGGPLGLGNVEVTGWLWVGSEASPVKHPRDTE